MKSKVVFLCYVFVIFSEVQSECSDFFECFGDAFKNFFEPNFKTETDNNNTEHEQIDAKLYDVINKNISVHSFDISHIEDDFSKVLTDVTNRVKEELENKLKIAAESDLYKQINNKSNVAVKIFNLDSLPRDMWMVDDPVDLNDHPVTLISKFEDDSVNTTENPQSKNEPLGIINVDDSIFEINTEIPIDLKGIPEKQNNVENNDINYTTDNYMDITEKSIDTTTETIIESVNVDKDRKQLTKENVNWKILEKIEKELEFNNGKDLNITIFEDGKINEKYFPKPELAIHNITIIRPTLKAITDSSSTIDIRKNNTDMSRKETQLKDVALNDTNKTKVEDAIETSRNLENKMNSKKINAIDFNAFNLEDIRLNEISKTDKDYEQYYDTIDQNGSDYNVIDYIDIYKDTTNENDGYKPTEPSNFVVYNNQIDLDDVSQYNTSEIFPWIATVFVKNLTNNQFDYVCDGAVLSDNIILTAARCIKPSDVNVVPEDIIIITGKKSLQFTEPSESVHRVKEIKIHSNFSIQEDDAMNDLVLLILEESIILDDGIVQAANIKFDDEDDAFTTGWAVSGNLTAIHFNKEKSKDCFKTSQANNTFCATYGNAEPTCPSFGGLYVGNTSGEWMLKGIRTQDNTKSNFCLSRHVTFTSLKNYLSWINESVNKM